VLIKLQWQICKKHTAIKANVNIMLRGGGREQDYYYIFCAFESVSYSRKSTNIPVLKENSFPVFNVIKIISH
jgi:hypothetical protein